MSLSQKVKLELDDGREVVAVYDGRDIRAWELKHHKSALNESLSVGMLTWLGHHAATRAGDLNGDLSSYEAFDKVCVSVEGLRDDEPEDTGAPDPTEGKPRRGSRKSRGGGSSAP